MNDHTAPHPTTDRGAVPRRPRWTALGVAALLAAGPLAAAACGDDPADAGSASTSTTASQAHDMSSMDQDATSTGSHRPTKGVLDVTASDYAFRLDRRTVPAGTLRIRFDNRGNETHQVQFGKAPDGVDAEGFTRTFRDQGDKAAFDQLEWAGGVNALAPGATGEASIDLVPGDYLVVCFVPTADGTSHLMKGMVSELHVTKASGPAAALPQASETVTLSDYHIAVPDGFRGHGEVGFRNEGSQPHEVVFLQLAPGKTLADAVAWQTKQDGPPPFSFAGGAGTIDPAGEETVSLDLEAGNYLAVCYVPGPGGQPHLAMGMVSTFTIA